MGTMLIPGSCRAPRMGDGEQGRGWMEVALEPGTLGGQGAAQQGARWTFSSITPFAAPCPPTCSFQGKGCLVRLSFGCAVARLDREPLENHPSKSCPSLCPGTGERGERWGMRTSPAVVAGHLPTAYISFGMLNAARPRGELSRSMAKESRGRRRQETLAQCPGEQGQNVPAKLASLPLLRKDCTRTGSLLFS